MANHHRRGGARDAREIVVLGQPEAVVTPLFCVAREIERVSKGLRRCAAFHDGRQIENGAVDHRCLRLLHQQDVATAHKKPRRFS